MTMTTTGFDHVSRPLTYVPRGGSPVTVRGVLRRPKAEEVVGSFEEGHRVAVFTAAALAAQALTTFGKYDRIQDPDDNDRQYSVADYAIEYEGSVRAWVRFDVLGGGQ